MDIYLQISKINDFIFCPKSIILHGVYENFHESTFHQSPQAIGRLKHENIDRCRYSTSKQYRQGMSVFNEKYGIAGKIDTYDEKRGILIERKSRVDKIYPGYRYQVYAQYFCLREMGFAVKKIYLHSLSDNKRYEVDIPNKKGIREFEEVLSRINSFDISDWKGVGNKNKCSSCIYGELCA